MKSDNQWHLNKSVPVTLIFAIAIQTIALIWFVATLRNDVDTNKERLIRNEARVETLEEIVQDQAVMLARIDENLKAIREAVERNAKE
jgi:hypothetical protein